MSDERGMMGIDLGCFGGLAVTPRSEWTCGGVLNSNGKSASDKTAAKNGADAAGVNKQSLRSSSAVELYDSMGGTL